jgi:heme/copper-type cytochrome/quinol oxidase subunit 2
MPNKGLADNKNSSMKNYKDIISWILLHISWPATIVLWLILIGMFFVILIKTKSFKHLYDSKNTNHKKLLRLFLIIVLMVIANLGLAMFT